MRPNQTQKVSKPDSIQGININHPKEQNDQSLNPLRNRPIKEMKKIKQKRLNFESKT
jgi:hypothetical protein